MNIAITGTTRDLGKAIFDLLSNNQDDNLYSYNHDEYDLETDILKVCDSIIDNNIDLLINSAYANGYQNKLLLNIAIRYNILNKPITIFNLNSVNAKRTVFEKQSQLNYTCDKLSLQLLSQYICSTYPNVNIVNIVLPMCDTLYNRHHINSQKIPPERIAQLIGDLYKYHDYHGGYSESTITNTNNK